MEDTVGRCSSSNLDTDVRRPVVVRVKRKASQSPLEAFWLEINGRPSKRPLLDFEKLSLSDSREKEELKNKKVFVQHIETVNSSDATVDILQSCLHPTTADSTELRTKGVGRKQFLKEGHKQEQLLAKSKQTHEVSSKNARFEQIWKSRKGKKDTRDDEISEKCQLYDVIRVDSEKVEIKDTSEEDNKALYDFLPLLKEFLPSAAQEIQADMDSYFYKQGGCKEEYVYDLYTMFDESNAGSYEQSSNSFPLVQVKEEDDFYGGLSGSEYETDDSNAEDNPRNDYPDVEETSEEEEDEGSETSCDEDEDEDEDDVYYDDDEYREDEMR